MSMVLTQGPGNAPCISASGLLLSCSALLLSSLASHPNPLLSYLVKLFCFLSPLVITSFLVFLALLTLSPGFVLGGMPEPRLGSLMGLCTSILNKFRTNADEGSSEFNFYEGSEVYRIIFEAPDVENSPYSSGNEESEPLVDKFLIYGDVGLQNAPSLSKGEESRPVQEIPRPDVGPGKKLGALLMEKLWCETEFSEETEVDAKVKAEDENSKKVVDEEKQTFHDNESKLTRGSEAKDNESELTRETEAKINNREDDNKNNDHSTIFGRRRQGSRRFGESSLRAYENVPGRGEIDRNLGSFGSMSRSKEWKRTLACKLFEERHNSEGEGMDSLWETYEDDLLKKDATKTRKDKKNIKEWKKESKKFSDDEEDGDEAAMDDKFCCLQALRLSAGRKMGLGVGIRPNIVRISKAFRGIGWLHHHHVVSHGHGKKG